MEQETEAQRDSEKQQQLKVLASLDFDSFATNKQDVKEAELEFGEKPAKKMKLNEGESKKKINKYKAKPKNPEQLKAVSSNWQKFLTEQKSKEGQETKESSQANTHKDNNNTKNHPNVENNSKQNQQKNKQTDSSKSQTLDPQSSSFKGDTPIVAIDCEMVQCQGSNDSTPTQELARVSIVNYNGHVLLDSYVRPQKKIKNYLTSVSGITFGLIKNAPTYMQIKEKIEAALKDKIIVGHSLQHDLDSIKFSLSGKTQIRDISNFKQLRNAGKKVSLKKMAKQELGINFQEGQHDSVSDARAALLVYKKYQKQIDQEQQQVGKSKK